MKTLFYDRAIDLPESTWRPAHTFLHRDYLRAIEEGCAGQLGFCYAEFVEHGEVCGGALFQRVDIVGAGCFPGRADGPRGQALALKALTSSLRISGVVCGNVFASGAFGFWSHREPSAVFRQHVVDTLETVRVRMSPASRCTLAVMKDLGPGSWHPEAPRGFQSFDEDPIMTLHLDPRWRGIRDYVADLRGSYRREYHRSREMLGTVRCSVLRAEDLARYDEQIEDLYGQVLRRSAAVPARLNARCFALLAERLPRHFQVVGYFDRDRLLAFNTRFVSGDDFESHFFGMEYGESRERALYRNILYDDIESAIAVGARRLQFGRCSQESKSAMGAVPTPLESYVRHPSRLLTGVVLAASRRLVAHSWHERHPFKARPAASWVRPPAEALGTRACGAFQEEQVDRRAFAAAD